MYDQWWWQPPEVWNQSKRPYFDGGCLLFHMRMQSKIRKVQCQLFLQSSCTQIFVADLLSSSVRIAIRFHRCGEQITLCSWISLMPTKCARFLVALEIMKYDSLPNCCWSYCGAARRGAGSASIVMLWEANELSWSQTSSKLDDRHTVIRAPWVIVRGI